jgi:hypothetical protein
LGLGCVPLLKLSQYKTRPVKTSPDQGRVEIRGEALNWDVRLADKQKKKFDANAHEHRAEWLGQNILKAVSKEDYNAAAELIKKLDGLHPEYPQFKIKTERYVSYAIDLVNGIKNKRNLANVKQLASAKQKELYDRALSHFEDLKHTLKKVEHIEHEVRLDDIRSTIWVVKALVHCTLAILVFFFLLEFSNGVFQSATAVADDYVNQLVDKTFDYLGI